MDLIKNEGIVMPNWSVVNIIKAIGYLVFSIFEWYLSGGMWWTALVIVFNNQARLVLTYNVKQLSFYGDNFEADDFRRKLSLLMWLWVIYLGCLIGSTLVKVDQIYVDAFVYVSVIGLTAYVLILLESMDSKIVEAKKRYNQAEKAQQDIDTYQAKYEELERFLETLKVQLSTVSLRTAGGRYYRVDGLSDTGLETTHITSRGEVVLNGKMIPLTFKTHSV